MAPPTTTTTLRVALDWTPNTLHTGLFVALHKNLYSAASLTVDLLPPSETYTTTPAKQLSQGSVDLAICPSESCIAYAESRSSKPSPSKEPHLQAIYAILHSDASAIVTTSPKLKDLAQLGGGGGAVYGSYNARYEDSIVRHMVSSAGGDGAGMEIDSKSGKLSLFDQVKMGKTGGGGGVDATWVFLPWEGVEAELEGVELNVFRTEDFGVPYGYSPVIARDAGSGAVSEEVLKRFVKATREGYRFAIEHPEEAAGMLEEYCRPRRSREFLVKSQKAVNKFYGDKGGLGVMSEEKWEKWVQWLRKEELLKADEVQAKQLFTNEFFS